MPVLTNRSSYGIDNAFLFGATALISDTCDSFINAYVRSVILHGFPLKTILPTLLCSSLFLAEHAHIIHLAPSSDPSKVVYTRMAFMHPTRLPAGKPIPPQCPSCFNLYTWKHLSKEARNTGEVTLKCKICGEVRILSSGFTTKFNLISRTESTDGGAWYQSEEVVKVF